MSSFELNKIIGAFLTVLLAIWVIGLIADALMSPGGSDEHQIAVVKADGKPHAAAAVQPAAEAPLEPVGPLLAAADAEQGQKIFKKCGACHTSENGGPNKLGPNLWNIVNANRARTTGFKYSDAMKAKEGSWSYESLNAFLAKPKAYIKGTKMGFAGLKKAGDRANVIAFLRSLSDSPAPLP